MKAIAGSYGNVIISLAKSYDYDKGPIWSVPPKKAGYVEIRDLFWSATFGICQEKLAEITKPIELVVDFSRLCWIDPLPLLGTFIALKTCCTRSRSHLTVLLGNSPQSNFDTRIRGGFLKFINHHGFLSALGGIDANVMLDGKDFAPDDAELFGKLDSARYMMAYPDSICLEAIIEPIIEFKEEDKVTDKVAGWTTRIKESGVRNFFEGEPDKFDDLTIKIHNVLVEILLNAGEHAYSSSDEASSTFIGLYARLREPSRQQSQQWLLNNGYITHETQCCPGFGKLELSSIDSTWLEFFYVDQGRGFLADIDNWVKNTSKPELKRRLKRIRPYSHSNPLRQIAHLLFKEPISRHERSNRTIQTGLQYVRKSLVDNEEGARLYSCGEWVSERLPWHPDRMGISTTLTKNKDFFASDGRVYFTKGTLWQFCLSLDSITERYGSPPSGWEKITSDDIAIQHPSKTTSSDWQIFDDRSLGEKLKSRQWHLAEFTTPFSLWLPELIRKNRVLSWMQVALNLETNRTKQDSQWVWIIADMSRKDASLMDSILSKEHYRGRRNSVQVYLVTRDWCVKCYKSNINTDRGLAFEEDKDFAGKVKQHYGAFILKTLRTHDSEIFWQGLLEEEAQATPFVPEKIIWTRGSNREPVVTLKGYLDLTQALLDPKRKFVAQRALERIWLLHADGADCVSADPLLIDLLPGDASRSLRNQNERLERNSTQIVVGSVFVTGGTARRAASRGQSVIHLMHHGEVTGPSQHIDPLRCALDWLVRPFEAVPEAKNKLPYERLPGTPFISRGGPKAAPIRRFVKVNDDLFSKSVYGKDPQQTYRDLIRFNLLKLGHWTYGVHHDLLTINLANSIESKRFYKETVTEWIIDELKKQARYDDKPYRVMVVYPSHTVTDKLVDAVKALATEDEKANIVFIPVRFWATHTQTAIRIPSLTYDRIRAELTETRQMRVVLLDDGAVTGKVQKEMEQLLCNAGAEEVVHLGLLTRTGLPLYRKYLEKYYQNYRYYWRWDVPPLGNSSTCPLCRALALAKEHKRRLWSKEAKHEIEKWILAWEANSVTSHWRRHGLDPERLPDTRKITFGKDWTPVGERKYKIEHETTTGLAATVMEIIRTTSYKDVGLKLARKPWDNEGTVDHSKWRDAQLELVICQLLIYHDDFDDEEIEERFHLLQEILFAPERETNNPKRTKQLEYLGCLALLLATDKQVISFTNQLWQKLEHVQTLDDHILLILGILMGRGQTYTQQLKQVESSSLKPEQKMQIKTVLTSAHLCSQGKGTVWRTRDAFFSLYLLLGKNAQDGHSGFFRKRILGEIPANKGEILRDLRTIEQALRDIDPHIVSGSSPNPFDPEVIADEIRNYTDQLQKVSENEINQIKKEELFQKFFGNPQSISTLFYKNIILTAEDIGFLLKKSIPKEKWQQKCGKQPCDQDIGCNECQYGPNILIESGSLNDLSNVFVICPSMAITMINELLCNIRHSSGRLQKDGVDYDMCCCLTSEDNLFLIDMINRVGTSTLPGIKPSEGVVSAHLIKNPVERNSSNGIIKISIRLPLIEYLYGREQ